MDVAKEQNDRAEFEATLLDAVPHVRAFARSLTRNREEADDLTHDAVVRALGAMNQFTPGTNFKAWIFTILRNLYYNGRRRQSSRFSSIDDMPGLEPSIEPSQESALAFNDFRRAFFQLTDVHREVLTLVGAGGLSYEEAAAVCDCRVGTVKSRVSRARAELKELLEGNKLQLTRRQMTESDKDELTESLETGVDPQQVIARRAKGR
jgi:RNA polymerase sigma-70 factor (ECF subfamily)